MLDKFLFDEAMDDPENVKTMLDIILSQNTNLKHPPQTEKEQRTSIDKIDLPASQSTVFTLSTKTLGVGSSSCGPRPLDKYMVWSDNTQFSYTLQLLK